LIDLARVAKTTRASYWRIYVPLRKFTAVYDDNLVGEVVISPASEPADLAPKLAQSNERSSSIFLILRPSSIVIDSPRWVEDKD
jgi:hypothetical protein